MGGSTKTRQVYSEIDEFLGLLTENQQNKIPLKLREFFKEEKDKEYVKGINANIPIKKQNLKEETLAIIALLNLKYWCEDEKEKERLRAVYAKNEKKYQEIMQIAFNPDITFKNNQKGIDKNAKESKLVVYKESIFKIILKKVLKFFKI